MSGYSVTYYRDVDKQGDATPNKGRYGAQYVMLVDTAGNPVNPGGGGGGGGDASAANQTSVQAPVLAGTATATKSNVVGSRYRATLPTMTDGQEGAYAMGSRSQMLTSIIDASNALAAQVFTASADGIGASTSGIGVQALNRVFNKAGTFDRQLGDATGGTFTTGAPITGTDRSATVTTTASVLMAANASRHGFYVVNDSAVDVYINPGATATATPGSGNIKVDANGGRYESGNFTMAGAISIIAVSATAAITAREF